MEKYCLSAIIIYRIIVFLWIFYLIYYNIYPIKPSLYEIKSKANKLYNDKRLKENISFIFKNYNISIYNKDEIEKDLMNISDNLINLTSNKIYNFRKGNKRNIEEIESDEVFNENYLLLEKELYLLFILNKQFEGNATHIVSLKEIFNSFQDLISYTHDIKNMNKLQNKLHPINTALFYETNPIPIKYALFLKNYILV